jgi:hypothetical protein
MPVVKYRSVAEMPEPAPVEKGSEAQWQRIARVWRRAALLATRKRIPGVRRFRSIADRDGQPASSSGR